jgi:hypothetical protein
MGTWASEYTVCSLSARVSGYGIKGLASRATGRFIQMITFSFDDFDKVVPYICRSMNERVLILRNPDLHL